MKDNRMEQKELLARMWLECDPNRQPAEPDNLIEQEGSSYNGRPNWSWFEPRAEASLEFFAKHGYRLEKIS